MCPKSVVNLLTSRIFHTAFYFDEGKKGERGRKREKKNSSTKLYYVSFWIHYFLLERERKLGLVHKSIIYTFYLYPSCTWCGYKNNKYLIKVVGGVGNSNLEWGKERWKLDLLNTVLIYVKKIKRTRLAGCVRVCVRVKINGGSQLQQHSSPPFFFI